MSGIAGIYRVDGQDCDQESIARMQQRMAHRGPDGAGRWIGGRVGLVHQRLATTPEAETDQQPFRDVSRRVVLTADARIDSRDELIAALGAEVGTQQRTVSDSQLICAAYRRWGRQCVDHLEGAFAFAIWDEQQQVLFCARDHFGLRPFYYHWLTKSRLVFASEIRPLLELPDTPRRINESRVADYLLDLENDKIETYYQDILRLPPAHWLEVREGRVTIGRYWSPDPVRLLPPASDREYADAFREVFEAAIHNHMRSNRPWAVALSGGIDSASVACVARKILTEQRGAALNCVCIEYDTAPGGDERDYFNAVIEQGGILPQYIKAESVKPLDNFIPLLECYDGPIDNPHYTLGWSVWEQIRRSGIQVLLDGIDGDVTVSYAFMYLQELVRNGKWLTLFRESLGVARNFYGDDTSPFSVLWQFGMKPFLPRTLIRSQTYLNREIVRGEFSRRMNFTERLQQFSRHERSLKTSRAHHCEEVTHGVVVASLEKTNKICSMFGIEPRHPFFDKKLIEFCIALPREQKIFDGWTRTIVRRAWSDVLPRKVLARGGKWEPSGYFAPRLLQLDRARLHDALPAYLPLAEPYIDADNVRRIFAQSATLPTVADALRLWNAINLGAWLQVSRVHV